MSTATSLGFKKAIVGDLLDPYLMTDLAGTMDLLNGFLLALQAVGTTQLVNGGMEVNQRGGTVTADLAYAHDRFQFLKGGTSTISITDETTIVDTGSGHSLKAVYTHGSAVSYIDQKLEHYLALRGRTITFAIRVRKGVASSVRPYIQATGARTYGATSVTTGAFTTMTVTLAIPAGATSVTVGVELSISDTVYLDNATLCVGTAAMDYVPVQPADDLLRCQRFYQEIGGQNTTEFVSVLQAFSTTDAFGFIPLPVEMMATPTGTVSAAADWSVFSAAGAAIACTTFTLIPTKRGSRLTIAVAAGLVAGNATAMRASATANARLRFESNPP